MSQIDHTDPRRNRILAALPERDRNLLVAGMTAVDVTAGAVLYQPGQPVDAVYFPLHGVFAIVVDLEDGQTVEVAGVGDEGMVGLPVFLDAGSPTERALCQIGGPALRLEAGRFRHLTSLLDGPAHQVLRRYTQVILTILASNAACHRSHTVQQRCARWLLTTADRMHSNQFPLTQEFLAQMLAVRRASVNEVATSLARNGGISYRRGVITLLDRHRLEAVACGCYRIIHDTIRTAFTAAEQAVPLGASSSCPIRC